MTKWTDAQLEAIQKDKSNIIVSAGAGSGKTAVLSERVIRKVKEGIHVNELLLLTFTNNAAKEMKERIRSKLKKEGLTEELKLIDSAYITTFDSYALSILKRYHYKLNISKDVKIVDADLINYKKEEYLDTIFEEYYESNDKLFLKLINDFCEKDDKDIRKSILSISSKLDLLIDLDDYLNNYNYFNESVLDDYNELLLKRINNIKILKYNLEFYTEGDFNDKLNESLKGLLNSNDYDSIKSNLDIKLPTLRNAEDIAKNYKDAIKKEIDDLKELCTYTSLEEAKDNIISTKDYVSIIIDIIKKLNSKLNKFKYENDLYEFNDIAKLSIKLLKDNEDIRNEIKYSLNEIMIDEYQDTSDIQEEFISLIENNNVYMVGDVKQSIYRFRNANPYIFKNKYDKYSNNDGGIKIDLNKNFRSREETLNNINILFNLIMDSNIGGADYKLSHQMTFGNLSYNEIGKTDQNNNFEIYNYDFDKEKGFTKEETEIFIVANDIKSKIDNKYKIYDKDNNVLRDCTYSDFVILLDRSKDFDLYKKIFEYKGIPISINKEEKVNDEIILLVIKNILISLVKINNNELDNDFIHAFISVLRSFVFEYTDEEIFELYSNNNYSNDKVFKELKEININSNTTKEIVNIIIDKFNIIDKLNKIGNIENNLVILEYLINYLDTKEEIGLSIEDISLYLDDILDKSYEIKFSSNKEDANSVRIMTIHKSKGLEYNICYYAGLYREFNIRDIQENFLFDKKYGIVTPYFKEGIGDTIYKPLIKENYIKEEISEKIRLFYVALTRAKEKMILLCDLNGEEYSNFNESGIVEDIIRLRYRSFSDIIMSIQSKLSDYITNITDIDMSSDYKIIKQYNFKDYIDTNDIKLNVNELEKDNEILESKSYSKHTNDLISEEIKDNMEYGTKVHNILEMIDFNNPDYSNIEDSIKNMITNFLDVDIMKNISKGKIYKEYEFMYEKDNSLNHGIIDLMIEYPDYIDIIDYKLKNISDENYIKQLKGYKEYIENRTNKKCNLYLYSLIDEKYDIII